MSVFVFAFVCIYGLDLFSVAPARAQWITPGPLASDHDDLDDGASCEKCHAPGKRVEASRCLACHDEVRIPLAAGRGYHARLVKEAGNRCESCHSDHKGRDYPLIRWSPPPTFDHRKDTGFELTGAHASAACATCHKERPAYMGAKTTCAGCHDDVHGGKLGTTCDTCHDTTTFVPARRFDHAKTPFPLTDRHTTVACSGCHTRDAAGRVGYDVQGFERCSTCHGDPHRGKTSLSPCTDCHTTKGWTDVQAVPPAHSPAGWPLVGKHAGVACADCHGANLAAKVSTACGTCHEDAHQGRFGKDCERCHDESGWRHVDTSRFDHSRTRYPLEGQHTGVRCDQCHKRQAGRLVYKGLPFDRCDRCHAPWHPEAAGALATVPSASQCEACHTVRGFEPSTFDALKHAVARMALDGSHLATPCATCHVTATVAATTPATPATPGAKPPKPPKPPKPTRPTKPVRSGPAPTPLAIGTKACAGCHTDPHGGQFDAQMAVGNASCAACHSTAGWAQGAFDHDKTAFPLRGIHADAACASCHKGEPVQYQGLATQCQGCHQDLHMGQFAVARAAPADLVASAIPPRKVDARDCKGCHDEQSFRIQPFDHMAVTGFALGGKHAPLECASCHDSRMLEGGTSVVHYRLGYDRCEDCHANPHRPLAAPTTPGSGRGTRHPDVPDLGSGCARCHVDTGWQQIATTVAFDHALTGFRLEGEHAQATCDACHGRPLRTDEARAACATCHDDVHRGEQGASCESCHDARRWDPSNALLRHRGTRFPLVGMHAAADCTACHDRTREETWRATPTDCWSCHAAEYKRQDVHPNHTTANFDRACDTCHSQASWSPARIRHDTYWPLRGAHATADCFQCHAGERYGGTPQQCYDCHTDDYQGALDPPHAAYGMDKRCERCHGEVAWSVVKADWHESSFPIRSGDHAGFGCQDCHFENLPPQNFTCIGCHGRAETDGHHDDVSGYVWENFACYGCHPQGDE